MEKPRRAIRFDLELDGDDWDEIAQALDTLSFLAKSRQISPKGHSISGGVGYGYILKIEEKPVTPAEFHKNLHEYLSSLREDIKQG